MRGRTFLIIFILCISPVTLIPADHFQSNCQTLDPWQLVDFQGDAQLQIVNDLSVPAGHGPEVIEIAGSNVCLLVKAQPLSDGVIAILWKDVYPQTEDADGILLFRGDLPENVPPTPSNQKKVAYYWLEQDYDAGCQLYFRNENGEENLLIERPGVGLVQDQSWNYTGWFWQKVKLSGENIYAKFWSAVAPEPTEWMLVTQHQARLNGRFGARVWSGRARIACFKASLTDSLIPPPLVSLHANFPRSFEEQTLEFSLFTNLPEALINGVLGLRINQQGRLIHKHDFPLNLNAGFERVILPLQTDQTTGASPAFVVAPALAAGEYEFMAEIVNTANDTTIQCCQKVIIQSNEKFKQKLIQLQNWQEKIHHAAREMQQKNITWQNSQLAADGAAYLIDLAEERWEKRLPELAFQALDAAEKALQRVQHFPRAYLQTTDFQLKFVKVEITSETLQMGATDTVTVWWQIQGESPQRNFQMKLALVDEYNRPVLEQVASPKIPTAQWQANQLYQQQFVLKIPEQMSRKMTAVSIPSVFTGWHYLSIAVIDPQSRYRGEFRPLLLENAQTMNFFPVGRYYTLRKIYIHSEEIQIKALDLPPIQVGETGLLTLHVQNRSASSRSLTCHWQLLTAVNSIIFEDGDAIMLPANQTLPVQFKWLANFAGEITCKVTLLDENQEVASTEGYFSVLWPSALTVDFKRRNQVEVANDEYRVPIECHLNHPAGLNSPQSISIQVFAEDKEYFQSAFELNPGKKTEKFIFHLWPFWGDYRIRGAVPLPKHKFFFETRLVATVVETRDRKLFVNGEPFIVKGVNVHNFFPQSRLKTDQAMKLLKAHGFNTLRGDYPPRWQLELARQNNLGWMVLPEFSVISSDSIFARFETDPLGAMQSVVRQFVLANREQSSILFWNSCNEITGKLDEILVSLYPVFKIFDPYQRPVIYANLFGQDNWHGQDLMGVNYYFKPGQTALSRQRLIKNSLLIGFAHKLPVIFTEYNSFQGPVEQSGAAAVNHLWHENLDEGMSGGILYQIRDEIGKHPGLVDPFGNLNIRQTMSQALKKYHADVQINAEKREANILYLKITNVRPFTIRSIILKVFIRKVEKKFQLATEIRPFKTVSTTINLPPELTDSAVLVQGEMAYETHFGLRNIQEFRLFFPTEK